MDRRTIAEIDFSDAKELRRYEARMSKRLLQLGFHLSKREIQPTIPQKQLKRVQKQRRYQIKDASTGEIVLGKRHEFFCFAKHSYDKASINDIAKEALTYLFPCPFSRIYHQVKSASNRYKTV